MSSTPHSIPYDVIVIGGGPAGVEAALAAGRQGAHTLCLAINLDNVGFPPATPILIENADDARAGLFEDLEIIGGVLPALVRRQEVATESVPPGFRGRLLVDRRHLGLAYKEAAESAEGVMLRQALATAVESVAVAGKTAWQVNCSLGERFEAPCVIVATGTFLGGSVNDAGDRIPGGRRGEIPANSLALCLQNLDLQLVEVKATSNPRVDSRSIPSVSELEEISLLPDGSQLHELLVYDLKPAGSRLEQLSEIRKAAGAGAWMTRASYTVRHLVLEGGQVNDDLESLLRPGLFFAGRAAGSCNYTEAAVLGVVAGNRAAERATGATPLNLTSNTKNVEKLCDAIAGRGQRPVTVRRPDTGC